MAFSLKKMFGADEGTDEYIEIDLDSIKNKENKVVVKPFALRKYDDVIEILNSLREGYTIAVIDIKVLKTKDVIELKRAISKIKKTADAIEGSIAGFGEHIIIVTPKFAEIHHTVQAEKKKPDFIG